MPQTHQPLAPASSRLTWLAGLALAAATVAGLVAQRSPSDPVAIEQAWLQPIPAAAAATVPADWRVSRLRSHLGVLVIAFPSLQVQAEALNRVAALIEKSGAPRNRVLHDGELKAFVEASGGVAATFLYGHDYSASQLARFYSLAAAANVELNAAEKQLLGLLIGRAWLTRVADSAWVGAADRALVSTAGVQADDPATPEDDAFDPAMRAAVLQHELGHGVYFVDATYRAVCRQFWAEVLTDKERASWRRYLASLGYEPTDEDLMINEMQAWLMHTPAPHGLGDADIDASTGQLTLWQASFRRLAGTAMPLQQR